MITRKIIQGLSAVAIAVACASGALADESNFYGDLQSNLPPAQGPVGVRASSVLATESNPYADLQSSQPPAQAKIGLYRSENAPFGSAAQGVNTARIIKISAATKSVNVNRDEVVTIANGEKAFAWKFATVGTPTIELAKIAPPDFGAGNVLVYVSDTIESD